MNRNYNNNLYNPNEFINNTSSVTPTNPYNYSSLDYSTTVSSPISNTLNTNANTTNYNGAYTASTGLLDHYMNSTTTKVPTTIMHL